MRTFLKLLPINNCYQTTFTIINIVFDCLLLVHKHGEKRTFWFAAGRRLIIWLTRVIWGPPVFRVVSNNSADLSDWDFVPCTICTPDQTTSTKAYLWKGSREASACVADWSQWPFGHLICVIVSVFHVKDVSFADQYFKWGVPGAARGATADNPKPLCCRPDWESMGMYCCVWH